MLASRITELERQTDYKVGFCFGFILCIVLCGIYLAIIDLERPLPKLPMTVEVYKFEPQQSAKVVGIPSADDTSPILKYGVPSRGSETLNYKNHIVGYDQAKKIPVWVAEHITKETLTGDADRDKCSFKKDKEQLDKMFSSTLDDYINSGYDRGHVSLAANHKYDQDAMCESFYLTNVLPQDAQNNRLYWKDFESYCRDLVENYEEVRVISGHVILPETPPTGSNDDAKRFVKYEVIGENDVTVPTHLYKILMVENVTASANTSLFSAAFLLPNKKIDPGVPLIKFKVPISTIEKFAGIRFFPLLNDSPVGDFCAIDPCRLQGEETISMSTVDSAGVSATTALLVLVVWLTVAFKLRYRGDKDYAAIDRNANDLGGIRGH